MGVRGTFSVPLGRLAVRRVLLLGTVMLGGCHVLSDTAGVVAGGGAAAATGNPAIGYVVGIGVRAAVGEIRKYVVRVRQRGEQDAIADIAGTAPLGEVRRWEIRHTIPIGNARGTLVAVAEIPNPLTQCRQVVFKTDDEDTPFATQLCRSNNRWQWAAAEPSVDRWGNLQ